MSPWGPTMGRGTITALAALAALLGLSVAAPMGASGPVRSDAELLALLRPQVEPDLQGCYAEMGTPSDQHGFLRVSVGLTGGRVVDQAGLSPQLLHCIERRANRWASPERVELELPVRVSPKR